MKSTESLKREEPENKAEKKLRILKQPCKLPRTEPLKTERPKNKP